MARGATVAAELRGDAKPVDATCVRLEAGWGTSGGDSVADPGTPEEHRP